MYCKYCGKEIANDSKFCRYCGAELKEREFIVSDSTDIISNSVTCEEATSIDERSKIDSLKQEDKQTDSYNESYHDNKIMKSLGILSGILLWGILAVFGLGLTIGVLFVLYMIIMMAMPNGMGITIFCIILLITVYLVIKLIINIIKSFRK